MATATLQRHMECPVCFDLFRNPHMLQCLHTYCLECLERLQKYDGQIECPECRQITCSKDLKKDFRVEGMVDSFGQLEPGISKDVSSLSLHGTPSTMKCVCTNASKPVVGHCDDCEEYLCSDCKAAHENMKITRTHKIKSITGMITAFRTYIYKASDNILEEINTIDLMSHGIDSEIDNITLDEKNKLAEVEQVLATLMEAIEKHRKILVNKITEDKDGSVKKLSAKQNKLKSNRLVLQSWLEYMENVVKSDDVAILSDVISLHGTTLAGNTGEIAEIGNEVKKMNITTESGIRLVKNDDMIDLKSIINVEVVEVSDMRTSGYHDFITGIYKEMAFEYSIFNGRIPKVICIINSQFWCGFVNEIGIFDKDSNIVKKISYKELENVQGISYTHTGDVIVSCSSGLHQLHSTGNYVRELKEGSFGRSFTFGEKLYVVDINNSTVLTLEMVKEQWVSTSEMCLACDGIQPHDQIFVKESGIYIEVVQSCYVHHYSLSGDLLQIVDVPQSEDGNIPDLIHLVGVDAFGNMLISYLTYYGGYKVQLFTSEKEWLDVPFLTEIGELIEWLWCQGDEVFVVVFPQDDYTLLRFTKE